MDTSLAALSRSLPPRALPPKSACQISTNSAPSRPSTSPTSPLLSCRLSPSPRQSLSSSISSSLSSSLSSPLSSFLSSSLSSSLSSFLSSSLPSSLSSSLSSSLPPPVKSRGKRRGSRTAVMAAANSDPSSSLSVVGIGEALWDVFDSGELPGGAPANVVYHAKALGAKGTLVTRLGQDELGDKFIDFCHAQGLDTKFVQRDSSHPTGTAVVDTSDAGQPKFTICEGVAYDYIELDPGLEDLIASAGAIVFGSLAQRNEVSRSTIQACLAKAKPSCFRVYDVNIRQNYYSRDLIESSLRLSDSLKLNNDELSLLSDLLGAGTTDEVQFAKFLVDKFDLQLVCITRGPGGCLVVSADGQAADVKGHPIQVADAVGAGDAFTAALIYSTLLKWPLEARAEFANSVGSLVASSFGAQPNIATELAQLKEKFSPKLAK